VSIDTLAASALFDGQEAECGDAATTELRRLLIALQDVTSERDQARKELDTAREAAHARAVVLSASDADGAPNTALDPLGAAEELAALRKENAELRKENANMFTLMEENDALRNETQTLRLRLECLEQLATSIQEDCP